MEKKKILKSIGLEFQVGVLLFSLALAKCRHTYTLYFFVE